MTQPPDISEQLARLGKGLVQLNLRMSQLAENGGRPGATPAHDHQLSEILFDVIDAVGAAIERRGAAVEPRRGLLARFRKVDTSLGDLWRGLSIARESALERMRSQGVESVPSSGPFDPEFHCAIETRPAPSPELAGTIAETHRPGWVLQSGGGRRLLRPAQVSVYEEKKR